MSESGQADFADAKAKHNAQGSQSPLVGVNASTTQLREVHGKFVDLTRKQLGELYEKRNVISETIDDKERALAVSEKLLESLQPSTPLSGPSKGW